MHCNVVIIWRYCVVFVVIKEDRKEWCALATGGGEEKKRKKCGKKNRALRLIIDGRPHLCNGRCHQQKRKSLHACSSESHSNIHHAVSEGSST